MITLDRLEVRDLKGLRRLDVTFPPRGAILVRGPNESGKSTLFEAIYVALYGAPLVTEEGGPGLESLIRHGVDAATVRLTLRTRDARLEVERAVRRGRSSRAELRVLAREGAEERISGVRAVNARLVAELGGLDGPALLNSCFVEQKKLAKLEQLDARERRDSLLRILNLDRLARLEESCRVRASDEARVRELAARAELARADSDHAHQRDRVASLRRAAVRQRTHDLGRELAGARAALDATEEHARALRSLAQAERREAETAAPADLAAGLTALRRRRDGSVLAGVAVGSGLFVAGLAASGAGLGPVGPALWLVAALAFAVGLVAAYRAALELEQADGEMRRARGAERRAGERVRGLRAALGLPDGVVAGDELGWAERAAGAAELRVRALETQLDGAAGTSAVTATNPSGDRAGEGSPSPGDAPAGARERTATRSMYPVGGGALAMRWEAELATPAAASGGELAAAERELHELEGRVRYLRETVTAGGEAPGTEASSPAAAESAHREAARALETRRRAGVILAEARRRIVERVLPETERNMRLILPLLTAGRYHDARLTEDYRVALWDDGAVRYVGKSVYSGGTQDQISLALRLAFAIASLPQELGASPGFLFMDEPLSSFDEERSGALVELITRGALAAIFPQICLISHDRTFDASLFPWRIQMDGGAIADATLPETVH